MALNDRSMWLLSWIRRNAPIMACGDCHQVPATCFQQMGDLTAVERTTYSVMPTFAYEGIYALSFLTDSNWGHYVVVIVIAGEALILQAWIRLFSVSNWLDTDAADDWERVRRETFEAAQAAFSPVGAAYRANPRAQFDAWRTAIGAMRTGWRAGNGHATNDAWKVLAGVDSIAQMAEGFHLLFATRYRPFNAALRTEIAGRPVVALHPGGIGAEDAPAPVAVIAPALAIAPPPLQIGAHVQQVGPQPVAPGPGHGAGPRLGGRAKKQSGCCVIL